jgi:hypothetical protein
LDVKRVRSPVVVLDGLGDSIEVPLLRSVVSSPSLHHDIVGTNTLSNSSEWKFGDQVEWSVDMESKVFVDSLGLWSLSFIKIYNIPLLSFSTVVIKYTNCLSFLVFVSFDVKNLVALPVDELISLVSKDLEPS